MVNAKDVLIAILVAYVVLDLAMGFMLRRKRPLLFQHMLTAAKKEKKTIFMGVVLAVAAGAGAYYIASQN